MILCRFIVLLRCDIFQVRSVSVDVSMKKSVVGSVSVFIQVHQVLPHFGAIGLVGERLVVK